MSRKGTFRFKPTAVVAEFFPMTHHLAQFNVARFIQDSKDHPANADFVANLDPVNAEAEAAAGFVWRLQDEDGDAMSYRAFDDPKVLLNLSVWEDWDSLKAYVYSGGHVEIMRRRSEWMERHTEPHLVMWWVPAGTVPTVDEAVERLLRLRSQGPSAEAFTPRHLYPPPTT